MRICDCLLVWINDDYGVALEACGRDDEREMIFFEDIASPRDHMERRLHWAVQELRRNRWVIQPGVVRNAIDGLKRLCDLPRFSAIVEERKAASERRRAELAGVGEFGGKKPRALWAGVRSNDGLLHLQKKIENALQRIGLPPEERKFTAHVTLARMKIAPREKIVEFLTHHALFASGPFPVDHFTLFSSQLGSGGSVYHAERLYPLT